MNDPFVIRTAATILVALGLHSGCSAEDSTVTQTPGLTTGVAGAGSLAVGSNGDASAAASTSSSTADTSGTNTGAATMPTNSGTGIAGSGSTGTASTNTGTADSVGMNGAMGTTDSTLGSAGSGSSDLGDMTGSGGTGVLSADDMASGGQGNIADAGGANAGGANSGGSSSGGADTGVGGGMNLGGAGNAGASAAAGGALGLGGNRGDAGNANNGTSESGEPRTLGYIGCSMSVNVAQGYQALGGERLWPPVQAYNGQVVQNWTNSNDAAWQAFDQQASMYGTPDSVWIMICIFSNMVTYDETKQMIANVRQRAPDAVIYITGQPLYEQGLSCDLAGNGGPELTDSMAQMAGDDDTQNVTYGGVFGPLSSAQRQDTCHANSDGQRALGQQAIDKWGE